MNNVASSPKLLTATIELIAILSLSIATDANAQEPMTHPAMWSLEEMMKIQDVGSVLASPDGRRVVSTVTEAVVPEVKSEYLTQLYLAKAG